MVRAKDFIGKTVEDITDIQGERNFTIKFTDGSVLEVDVEPQNNGYYGRGTDELNICPYESNVNP